MGVFLRKNMGFEGGYNIAPGPINFAW